jgi:hypothetical protein
MLSREIIGTPPQLRDTLNRFRELELEESPSIVPFLCELAEENEVRAGTVGWGMAFEMPVNVSIPRRPRAKLVINDGAIRDSSCTS